MAQRKPKRKKTKQKVNKTKYHEKIKIEGTFDDAIKELANPIKKEKMAEIEILDSFSEITKWEQLTNDYQLPYRAGEKQSFKLSPYHKEFKTIFQITGIFHVTTLETDFILDTEITTIVKLETNGITPKSEQLYQVYLKIRPQWIGNILQESMKRGYKLILNEMPPDSFERMKIYLDEVIYRSIEE